MSHLRPSDALWISKQVNCQNDLQTLKGLKEKMLRTFLLHLFLIELILRRGQAFTNKTLPQWVA